MDNIDKVQKGFEQFRLGNSVIAVSYFEAALARDRTNDQAWFGLGIAKLDLGENAAAAEAFTACVELANPTRNVAAAYALRSLARSKLKDNEGAILDYSKATIRDPMISEFFRYQSRGGATQAFVWMAAYPNRAVTIIRSLAEALKVEMHEDRYGC
jgi:tetratricopeptide (TPR) repeat protein